METCGKQISVEAHSFDQSQFFQPQEAQMSDLIIILPQIESEGKYT
jgi:hypothetical protein